MSGNVKGETIMNKDNLKSLLIEGAKKANQGDWTGAEKNFLEVLHYEKNNPAALSGLGGVLFFQEKYSEAENVLKSALYQKNVMPQSYYFWAKLCMQKGLWNEVVKALLKAINLSPEISEQYLLLGEAYFFQRKWAEAACAFGCFIQRNPSNLEGWKKIAKCWHEQGLFASELEAFRQMIKNGDFCEDIYLKIHALLEKPDIGFSLNKAAELKRRYELESETAVALKKQYEDAILLLNNGKIRLGFETLYAASANRFSKEIENSTWWNGDYFSRKRLVIIDDCSFFDNILFLRYLPEVKKRGGIVILAIREEWVEVAQQLEHIDYVVQLEDKDAWEKEELKTSLCALPWIFGASWNSSLIEADILKRTTHKSNPPQNKCIWVSVSSTLEQIIYNINKECCNQSWQLIDIKNEGFLQCLTKMKKPDVLLTDERTLCQWAGLSGIKYLYMADFSERYAWWLNGQWDKNAKVIYQIVPGDWYGTEAEIRDLFVQEKKCDEE